MLRMTDEAESTVCGSAVHSQTNPARMVDTVYTPGALPCARGAPGDHYSNCTRKERSCRLKTDHQAHAGPSPALFFVPLRWPSRGIVVTHDHTTSRHMNNNTSSLYDSDLKIGRFILIDSVVRMKLSCAPAVHQRCVERLLTCEMKLSHTYLSETTQR